MTPAQAELAPAPSEFELDRPGDDRGAQREAPRVYRGRDLNEILPQIRAELGPEAVVICQREGLVGGIGGFFAQRFVEVEAVAVTQPRGIDLYDGEDADPDASRPTTAAPREPAEPLSLPALEQPEASLPMPDDEPLAQADSSPSFSELLAPSLGAPALGPALELHAPGLTAAVVESLPSAPSDFAARFARPPERPAPTAQQRPQSQRQPASPPAALGEIATPPLADGPAGEFAPVVEFLVARGLSAQAAEALVSDARQHDLPFAGPGGMRAALRACLTRRLPRYRGLVGDGVLVAVIGGGGAGKTRAVAGIAAAYGSVSALDVRAVVLGSGESGHELGALLGPHGVPVALAEPGSRIADAIAVARSGKLVVADTRAVSPGDPSGIAELATELYPLGPEEVLVALPATSNARSARQMLAALEPCAPSGIIATHADETDQLGILVELSLRSELPIVFIQDGVALPGALALADPATIAERLLA